MQDTPISETPGEESAATPASPTILERVNAIIEALNGLNHLEAIAVFGHVAEAITGVASREASIVKTKFEEAILWLGHHIHIQSLKTAPVDEEKAS